MDLQKRFAEILKKLSSEWTQVEQLRSRIDPENTPYKSKYEAVEMLIRLRADLEPLTLEFSDENDHSKFERIWLVLFALYFELAITHMDTEELAQAEVALQKCLQICNSNLNLNLIVLSYKSNDKNNELDTKQTGENEKTANEDKVLKLSLVLLLFYNQLAFLKSMKLNFKASIAYLKEAEKIHSNW